MDSRRNFLRGLALGGAFIPAGRVLFAEEIHLGSRVIEAPGVYRSGPAIIENGKVIQPRHEIKVLG